MGPLGVPELIFIFVMALLIFGPKKLPQLGKTFGKSMAEFRRASNDLRNTFQREMDSIERESQEVTQEVKKVTQEVKKDLDTSNYYDDGEDDYSSDYDQTPYEDKSSSSTSSAPASQDTATAKASTNGNDAKASASSNDGTPPDEAPSTVDKSTEAAEVKTT